MENTCVTDLNQSLYETELPMETQAVKLNTVEEGDFSEGGVVKKKKRKLSKKAKLNAVPDEIPSAEENVCAMVSNQNLCETELPVKTELSTVQEGDFSEGGVVKKKKRKLSKKTKLNAVPHEIPFAEENMRATVSNQNLCEMELPVKTDLGTVQEGNFSEGDVVKKKKRKLSKKNKLNVVPDEFLFAEEKMCLTDLNQNLLELELLLETQIVNLNNVQEGDFSEGGVVKKKKRKLSKKNKLNVVPDEIQLTNTNKSELGLAGNHDILESNNSVQPLPEGFDASGSKEIIPQEKDESNLDASLGAEFMADPKKKKRKGIKTNPPPDHIQVMVATKSDPGVIENILLTDLDHNSHDADTKKRKKSRRKKESLQGNDPCTDKEDLDPVAVNVLETDLGSKLPEVETSVRLLDSSSTYVHSLDDGSEKSMKIKRKKKSRRREAVATNEEQAVDGKIPDSVPKVNLLKANTEKHMLEANPTAQFQSENSCVISDLTESIPNETILVKKDKKRKRKKRNSKNARLDGHIEGQKSGEASDAGKTNGEICLYPKAELPVPVKRKLLVLDVNGLLAEILFSAPKNCEGYFRVHGRAGMLLMQLYLFVGKLETQAAFLLGKNSKTFKNMEYCTKTGFITLDNKNKPLVCKELRKIWESNDPRLPWKKGDYDETNTLLLDDSPYKALLNPVHTAIFPYSYSYRDERDNALGPAGDLRMYLKGLLESENVQKYIEQHPFGQSAIDERHESWEFYSEVLRKISVVPKDTLSE